MVYVFIYAQALEHLCIPHTLLCFHTSICNTHPTVYFIKAVNSLQSLFN